MMSDDSLISPDLAELKRRYREERDRRIASGHRAVPELVGALRSYTDDPYVTPQLRDPVEAECTAVVVGAGFSGLLATAKLRDAGVTDIRIIEKAGDVGGVWYWNRYPGAMCDIESYIYLPLLEETSYIPTEKYTHAPEILEHAQRIAKHYAVYEAGLFQTTVASMAWREESHSWLVRTDRGDAISARFVIVADGAFSHLKLPDIPGIEKFKGRSFHTSRWDYNCTGGSPETPELSRLLDKRVGVIGTGATALQCVPPLAQYSEHLYVFQRTPSTVAVRANQPTDPAWVATLEPGWQRERLENFTSLLDGGHEDVDLVADGWTEAWRALLGDPIFQELPPEEAERLRELRDVERMEEMRSRVESIVKDNATAEALKPYYRYLCKRPGFHDEYLPAFNRPNVTLVDTHGLGVERIVENGVIVAGREYELDLIVFATGFDNETGYARKLGVDVIGRNGTKLVDKWADGLSTLHGLMTGGFPNMFVLPGSFSQSATTFNFMHLATENAIHSAYIVSTTHAQGPTAWFDVDPAAEEKWVAEVVDHAFDNAKFLEECTPGRFNNEGRLDLRSGRNASYPGTARNVFRLLKEWRVTGEMPGLTVRH
jgi:cation diffusion facilitator CzcD-associated flavoprotein CzcO